MSSISFRVRQLFATLAQMTSTNPVLLEGEQWTEKDATTGHSTGRRKVGNGTTAFNSLPFEPNTLSSPTAHAASHGTGGADVITVAQSQVTGLATALSGKESTGTAAAAVAAHEAAADPHPGYLTPAEANAAYATAAQGVTNGDSHDHSDGDGAQIAYSSLSGLPTIPAPADAAPAALAAAAAIGTSSDYAREDHVHPLPAVVTTSTAGLAPATSFSTLTYGASVAVDFAALDGQARTITLSGNLELTSSNLAAGRRTVIRMLPGASQRTLTFPVGWVFVSTKPANIAANKSGILSLTAFGTTDGDVIAAWAVQP